MAVVQPEQALFELLTSESAVTNVVASRVRPLAADPADAGNPYITYQKISTVHYHHATAASGIAQARIQVDAFADSYSTVKTLADAMRLALDGYRGTVTVGADTLAVREVWLDGHQDIYEEPKHGEGKGTFRVSQDYLLGYDEVIPTFP